MSQILQNQTGRPPQQNHRAQLHMCFQSTFVPLIVQLNQNQTVPPGPAAHPHRGIKWVSGGPVM